MDRQAPPEHGDLMANLRDRPSPFLTIVLPGILTEKGVVNWFKSPRYPRLACPTCDATTGFRVWPRDGKLSMSCDTCQEVRPYEMRCQRCPVCSADDLPVAQWPAVILSVGPRAPIRCMCRVCDWHGDLHPSTVQ